MNEKMSNIIKSICDVPVDMEQQEEYLVISDNQIGKILTNKRVKIIEFLRDFNPVNEKKLNDLFGNIHKDLVIMNYLKIINIQKINDNSQNNIITLNRKLRILN